MKPIYIEFVDSGVANRFEFEDHEVIEVNYRLKNYPELFRKVISHEMGHGDNTNLEEFKYDMKSKTPGLFNFMAKHISTWSQVLPFYYSFRKNKVVYDVSYILSGLMVIGIGVATFFVLKFLGGI